MRPLTLRQKSVLGLFVLVSGALLALCVMLLLGTRLGHPQRPLRARFTENISGLDVSAPVRYQGLKVGRVEAIYVAQDAPEAIEVLLNVDSDVRLFEGTIAQLDPAGLTGLKAINLTPGNTQGRLLAANALLPSRGSFVAAITHDAQAMIADVRHVADQLNHLLGDAGTRTHVEHLIAGLDRLVSHTDAVVSDPNQPLQQMIGHVDDLVTTTTRTAETITQTVQGLHRLLEHNAQGFDQLGPTVQSMARLVDDADSLVRAGRDDLLHTLGALREASDNAKDLSALVADNPAVILRGR